MKIIRFFALMSLMTLFYLATYAQESVSIVPYPKEITAHNGFLNLEEGFTVGYSVSKLAPAANLLIKDIYTLYKFSSHQKNGKPDILLSYDNSLAKEAYTIKVDGKRIVIKGADYNGVCMGVTSLLQLAALEGDKLRFPQISIKDKPTSAYRGVLLDVARKWHNIETVKQVVELCRWYKINYLQLHLSDDQLFTFPSSAFPLLASDKHYTINELKDLVEFAKTRGVMIIPEFDAPGHTGAVRRQMPELFGDPGLAVLDMTNEKVYKAMETIIKEMIDVFYTSPYFHIGADEAWLGEFEKMKQTSEYIKKKGFDNAHDIYLDFIVQMHNIVKKYNRKTLVWESFAGTGSNKVPIPKDLTVFAWETAYQRPDSLLKNGYTIINASWKPAYLTPGLRWRPEYIYNWNIHRWENQWYSTPSYINPIQLDKSVPVLGGQLCAWEMTEEQEIPSLHQRIPAISEVFWNGDNKKDYADFKKRYNLTDYKYNRIIFPVEIDKDGFTEPDYEGIYYNRENLFASQARITFKSLLPGTKITYTTDGSMPGVNSPRLPETLNIDKDFLAKLAVFDNNGHQIGYKIITYELNAITPKIIGRTLALRDTDIVKSRVEFINDIALSFDNLKEGSVIRYTIDGSTPTVGSTLFSKSISIDKSMRVKAACFYKELPFGRMYESEFIKKDYEKNITTGKKIFPADGTIKKGENIEKAIDGFVDNKAFWSAGGKTSVIVDLGDNTVLSKLSLFPFWDDHRFYTYDIELSTDKKKWNKVIDRSSNKEKATKEGYRDQFPPQNARYIRVNMLSNSENNSMRIVEIRAY